MTPELWKFITDNLTPLGMVIGLAWLIHKKVLVLGRELAAAEQREEYWRDIAERTTGLLEWTITREERQLEGKVKRGKES